MIWVCGQFTQIVPVVTRVVCRIVKAQVNRCACYNEKYKYIHTQQIEQKRQVTSAHGLELNRIICGNEDRNAA